MDVLSVKSDNIEVKVSETNYCQRAWNEFTMMTNEERTNYCLIEKFLENLKG